MSSKVCKRTLCVKNLPQPSDNLVSSLFGPLGGVLLKVITTGDNNRKDILVEFESEELASKAREAMHGKMVDGTNLFVDYAIVGQPSFTSPSKDKSLKQKVSVLDRIIKPGNLKSSKAEDKNSAAAGSVNGKEGFGPDNQDNSNTSQKKPAHDGKIEKGQVANVGKKGQNKKGFLQGKHRGGHKMQKKLEIIKPKQEPPRVIPEENKPVLPKEVSTIMKDNPELTGNPQLVKQVYELFQKKLESNSNKEIVSRTTSKSRPYDSSVKKKPHSRSRSRSRGPSYPRHNRSDSHGRPDSYYYPNPRRSRSPSHQRHAWRPRSRSRSRSYDKNATSRRDYPYTNNRDPYYDSRYKDANPPYYRRSRSRSGSRRGDYSPYRDRPLAREGDRYYRGDRSRSRSRSRPRSRSRSWSRNRSRPEYLDYRRSSRSRSHSPSGYRDSAYRKEAIRSKYVTKGGLVIEKKTTPRKMEGPPYGDTNRYDRREYSRSRSRDRRYSRSRSGDRAMQAGQAGQKREVGYYRYRERNYGKRTEGGDRSKKPLDNTQQQQQKQQQNQQQRNRNAKTNSQQKQPVERNKEPNQNQREKSELAGVVKSSDSKNLEPVTTNDSNQLYSNYMNLSNLQFFPNMLNFSNAAAGGGPSVPAPQSDSSLPTYLYSSSAMETMEVNGNGLPDINIGQTITEPVGVPLSSEAMATEKVYEGGNKAELEEERGVNNNKKDPKEDMETCNLENSTTENSNIDVGKNEDKGDLLEQMQEDKGESINAITNDFIKKNKMQAFINYIIATGDIQGLKEKLKSIEKPKEN